VLYFARQDTERWGKTEMEVSTVIPTLSPSTGCWVQRFFLPINNELTGDKIEKNDMGGACSECGGEGRRI